MQMALSCAVEMAKHWTGKQWHWWIISEPPEHPDNGELCIIALQAKKLCFCFWLSHWNWHNHGQTMKQSEMETDHFCSQSIDTKLAIGVDIATMVCFEGTHWEEKCSFSMSDCCVGTAIILDRQCSNQKWKRSFFTFSNLIQSSPWLWTNTVTGIILTSHGTCTCTSIQSHTRKKSNTKLAFFLSHIFQV